jgi:hypothetical protein
MTVSTFPVSAMTYDVEGSEDTYKNVGKETCAATATATFTFDK